MSKIPLSIVILAKNEEKRIEDCIKSVREWANEVIVVDDESTDNTPRLAKELGAKVLVQRMDVEGKHRNWAYSKANNEWVLSLDADERLTEELKVEIEVILAAIPKQNAFTIPRRNFIGDYWIRWGGDVSFSSVKIIP